MLANFTEFELILLNKFYLVLTKHFGQRMARERATTGTPPTQTFATGTPTPSRRGEALIKQNEQLTQQLNNSNIKMQELVTLLDSLEEQLESKEEKIKELEVEKGQLKQDVDALKMQLTGTKSDLMMEQDKTKKLLEQKHYLTRQIAAKDNFLRKAEEQIAHLKRHNGLTHGDQLEQLKQQNEQLQLKIAEKDDAYKKLYKAKMRNEYKIKKLASDNSVMKYTIDSLKMLSQDVVEKRKLNIEKLDTLHHALEEISTMTGDIVQEQVEDIEQEQAKRQKIEIDANNYSQRENGVVICNGCGYVCQSMKGYKSHFTRRHKDLL